MLEDELKYKGMRMYELVNGCKWFQDVSKCFIVRPWWKMTPDSPAKPPEPPTQPGPKVRHGIDVVDLGVLACFRGAATEQCSKTLDQLVNL